MKSITIVIPNYNGMKYLEGCLGSLQDQTDQDFDVIMIDNGSGDGSVEYVREHFPGVRIRAFHRNTGFCRAVNEGIRMSKAPYVLLLNNDVVCEKDMVKELRGAMERRPKAFSCCAKLVKLSDPSKIDDAGDYFSALGWAFARGKGLDSSLYRKEEKIFACCGAAAIYRRAILEETGLFDERHFAYLEDIDLGYRAQILGYENVFVPSAVVRHAGSGTSGSRHNAFKVELSARNSVWLVKKNMPAWQILLNLPFLFAGAAVKWIYFCRKKLGKEYVSGLAKGLRTSGAFRGPSHSGNGVFWRIQLQLMYGCILRLCEVVKHSD